MAALYRIAIENSEETGTIKGQLYFDADHPIYRGHFPGQPVTPGVCQIEAIREIVSGFFNRKLHLVQAKDIKFVGLIIPDVHPVVDFSIDYQQTNDGQQVKAILSVREQIFLKMRATFGNPTA